MWRKEKKRRDHPARDALVKNIHDLEEVAVDKEVLRPALPGGSRSGDPVDHVRDDVKSGEQDQAEKQYLRRALVKQGSAERNEEQSDARPDE